MAHAHARSVCGVAAAQSTILNADGSARVKLDGTDCLAAVKLETAEPDPDEPDMGRVSVSTRRGCTRPHAHIRVRAYAHIHPN